MLKSLILLSFVFSLSAFATSKKVDLEKIEAAVNQFYIHEGAAKGVASSQTLKLFSSQGLLDSCDEDEDSVKESCLDVACDYLGSSDCDDNYELEAIGKMCRGVRGGSCIRAACERLGSSDCDDSYEIENVTKICRGHFGGSCIAVACKYLGSSDCDDSYELEAVSNNACRGVTGRCVEGACRRLGSSDCDDMYEIEAVGRICRGE